MIKLPILDESWMCARYGFEPVPSVPSVHHTPAQKQLYRKGTFHPKKPKIYDSPRKKKMQAKINQMKKNMRRMQHKIGNMKELIRTLKEKKLVNEDVNAKIMQMFASDSSAIFKNYAKNQGRKNTGRRYSQQLKHFALTLYYYAPKAYQFCR